MKQKKIFCKRLLTLVLSLAMVFTSVNFPVLDVQAAVENTYESTSETHGATYDETAGTVTFFIKDGDAEYSSPHMWYKEYDSYASAAAAHISQNNGDFITGLGATNYTEADGQKTATVTVSEGTGAILYYFCIAAGSARTDYEHIIVIDPDAVPEETEPTEPTVPGAVLGGANIVGTYWTEESHPNYGDIHLAWPNATGATSYEVSVDGKVAVENVNTNACFVENIYAAGEHTVSIVGINEAGRGEAGVGSFTLTEEQAAVKDGGEGGEGGEGGDGGESTTTDAVSFADADAADNVDLFVGGAVGWGGSAATYTVDGTRVTVNATNTGTEGQLWELQLKLWNETLAADTQYQVSFDITSNANKAAYFKVAHPNDVDNDDDDYTLAEKTLALEADKSQRVAVLTTATEADTDSLMVWAFGKNGADDAAAADITVSNLVITPATEVAGETDKAELLALYTAEKAVVDAGNNDVYTAETWDAYVEKVTAAKAVLDNEGATLAEVFAAYDALAAAKKALKTVVVEELKPVDPADCVDLAAKKAEEGGVFEFTTTGLNFAYEGTAVTITAGEGGWGDFNSWNSQLGINNLPVTAGKWEITYDIVSSISKTAYSKVTLMDSDTPLAETGYGTWTLTAGETERITHKFNVAEDGNVRLFFNLGNGEGNSTVTISNVQVNYKPYVNIAEKAELSKEKNEHGVFEYTGSGATFEYDDYAVKITAEDWGNFDWWSNQFGLNGLDVTKGLWQIEYDIVSTVEKPAYSKVNAYDTEASAYSDTPLVETSYGAWTLKANEAEHITHKFNVEKDGKVRLLFNLGGSTGAGTVTISNVKIFEVPLIAAPALNVTRTTKSNGFVAGVENVAIKFADNADWRNAVQAVVVNNKTLDASLYSFAEGTLTLDKSVTSKEGVYTVVVDALGYQKTSVTLPVYDSDVTDENWVLDWSDEFNGSKLDTTKWDYETGIRSGDDATSSAPEYWGNSEMQYYTEDAVKVKDGKLIITADYISDEDLVAKYGEENPIVNDADVQKQINYTSARIRTVSEDGESLFYGTTYGRVEAKMELPHGTGYWPAFWMLPTNETVEKYGTWASSGEIDIMEAVGQSDYYVNGTIHYGSTWPNNVYSGGTYNFPEGQNFSGAHVYAIEWEPGEIRWYVDDVLYHVENNWYASAAGASADYSYPAPFDEDFYILLNLAMAGNYVGNVEPSEDEYGMSMKVDYVRVYKDTNADYEAEVEAPDLAKDSEFYDANKIYADEDGNYIKDPEFTTMANHALGDAGILGGDELPVLAEWYSAINTGAGAGAAGTASVAERDGVKYAKIDVTQKGAQAYNVQLIQHVPLAEGYTYRLTFDAYTDKEGGRTFSVAPKGDADNGWDAYDTSYTATLDSDVESFEYIFTMSDASDPTARIEMNIGNDTGAVYVGNVKLYALTDEEMDQIEADKLAGSKDPLSNGEHIYNGAFDQGDGRFVYWQTEGDYTVDTSNRTMYATIEDTETIDDARLIQPGIQLLALDNYTLTLDASAAAAKTIKVGLYSATGDVYAEKEYEIGTETSTITLDFTMPKGVTDKNAVLAIAFGGDTTAVEIDNVSMMRNSNNNAEWDKALLYPLGGETWATYMDYENGQTVEKEVPADGVVVENLIASTNNYDYMVFKAVTLKTGYTYKLSYDIKTDVAGKKVAASIQQDDTWLTFGAEDIATTTEYQTISKEFTATTEGAMNLKFCISDSGNGDTVSNVYIKNVKLTVVGAPYVTVTNAPETMKVDSKVALNVEHAVEVNSEYEVFTYVSDNTEVATVEDGILTAKSAGEATITVTSGTGAYTSFTVTVADDAEEIEQADTATLEAAITEYVVDNENGTYTSESYAEYADAFDAASAILEAIEAGVIYSQDAVDAAIADLKAAYEALEEVATEDDIAALREAIAEAAYVGEYADSYTAESYAVFESALTAANKLQVAGECSKADVEKAIAKLEAAIEGLETIATEDDTAALSEAIAKAEDHLDVPYYTSDSYAAFEKAYNKAVAVAADLEEDVVYSSEDILKVADKLFAAIDGLTEKEGLWIEKVEPQVYTGSAIKPEVVVWDGAVKLELKKDYTVSYKKNTNVGDAAEIIVTGKGNYQKKDTFTFEIVAKNVSEDDVTIADVYTTIKNNKVTNPKVTAKYGKKAMKLNKDYSVTYPEIPVVNGAPKAGDYEIVIKGMGNYTGVTTINYEVRTETVLMSKASISLDVTKVTYAGEMGEETQLPVPTVKVSGTTLTEYNPETGEGDYIVSYDGWNVVGKKATVTVTAVDGSKYYGSKSKTYTVEGYKFASNTIEVTGIEKEYPYTGDYIRPYDNLKLVDTKHPIVSEDGATASENVLTIGRDFTIDYAKNKDKGTATITFTGCGIYTGTVKKTFKITQIDFATANAQGSPLVINVNASAAYNKNGATPSYQVSYDGEPLELNKDFTVTINNNKKVRTATIVFNGKGNFKGKSEVFNFEVCQNFYSRDDMLEMLEATDVLLTKNTKASKLSSKITVTEFGGKKLTAGTDYKKITAADYYVLDDLGNKTYILDSEGNACVDLVPDLRIYADVELQGNYGGTGTVSFRLYDKKMSSVTVAKIADQTYTGFEIEPGVVVTVKTNEKGADGKYIYAPVNAYDETTGEGAYVVSYTKNVNKGTAKVTITGVGEGYGGTKTVNFKIKAETVSWAEDAMRGITSFFQNLFN